MIFVLQFSFCFSESMKGGQADEEQRCVIYDLLAAKTDTFTLLYHLYFVLRFVLCCIVTHCYTSFNVHLGPV